MLPLAVFVFIVGLSVLLALLESGLLPPQPAKKGREEKREEKSLDHTSAGKMSGFVILPDGLEEIGWRLFEGNKNLTSVVVPGSVKSIGDRAFADCENLTQVVLMEGIEAIGSNVFTGCPRLRRVTYPDSVKTYQGWTFYGTNLEAPVLNASGTLLVFCPKRVSGKEWSVPDTVKTIAWQAFIENRELETLHLPEGLETIEEMAFIECGIREITIPRSVREIGAHAFWRCENLEKVTILNPEARVGAGAFGGCKNLKTIGLEDLWENDKIFHLTGQPFLTQHLESRANLPHRDDPYFLRLIGRCGQGDADAMYGLAEWFETWAQKPGASPFYTRATNHWRYKAYCLGNEQAREWFFRFFREHPGEHLESILHENSSHRAGFYTFSIPGALLNDLGYSFFDPARSFEIKKDEGSDLVIASAYESFDPPDEDGFGAETNYDWWFLDENLQPIPGVKSVNATVRETEFSFFTRVRDQALAVLSQRRQNG